jgi:hydroxymethylpyrimidine/phosphomethylpyrimidine kinase
MKKYTRVLTIAGSDSSGGAGIQADLKTIAACGCYGMSVITAVTAQNTRGVAAIHPVPASIIDAQIRAVLEDIGADAIKIGMLYSPEAVAQVAAALQDFPCGCVVLDPVMIATSGDPLMRGEIGAAMKERLFPLVRLLTPNIPEAESLLGCPIGNDLADAACRLGRDSSLSVLMKAGHLQEGLLVDVLYDKATDATTLFENRRLQTGNTHGTGCTLSSAVAAFAARGLALADAVREAEVYLHGAIEAGASYVTGGGHGPVHHFYRTWPA